MPYKLIYTDSYIKRAAKFLKQHPDMTAQYEKALKLLELNPYHPSLRLHALKGTLEGLCSVSINLSYRITIEMIIVGKEIILVDVGHHHQIY
ncbi:MAG: hypothetical protein WA081_01545 [Desulfosalsimonadaceae bacterium]